MIETPRIFISYAWESPEHMDRVLAFADWFEVNGIEVIFDQYDPNPTLPWPKWMDKALREATYVLCICTKSYFDRVTEQQPAGEGLGAQWEGTLIYNALNQQPDSRNKFQVVQFDEEDRSFIPPGLAGNNRYLIKGFTLEDPRLEDLYRIITNQIRAVRPKRGDIVKLPSVERTTIPRSGIANYEATVSEIREAERQLTPSILNPPRKHAEVTKGKGGGTYVERMARANLAKARSANLEDDLDATLYYSQRALTISPNDLAAVLLAGNTLYALDRYREAYPLLKQYNEKRPDDFLPLFRLLRCEDEISGANTALQKGARWLDAHPEADCVLAYASLCSDLNQHQIAIDLLEKYSAKEKDFSVMSMLAVYKWFNGEGAQAAEILESLPKEFFSPIDWINLGVGRAEMGRFGLAIEAINHGTRMAPKSKFGNYALAEIYAMMGETEAAILKLETLRVGGSQYLARVKTDRTFDPVRNDPMFVDFVATI